MNQRFTDDGFEAIEDQSFTDNETGKTYSVDYFDEVIDLCNKLNDDKIYWEKCYKGLIKQVDTFRAGNDTLQSRVMELMEENEQLKQEVDYWKQVASQYSNEVNVLEHKLKGDVE